MLQFSGERRRAERSVTTDVDASQKNDKCHDFALEVLEVLAVARNNQEHGDPSQRLVAALP
jgi:hypothetical protein